jgi:hypothetical protein
MAESPVIRTLVHSFVPGGPVNRRATADPSWKTLGLNESVSPLTGVVHRRR